MNATMTNLLQIYFKVKPKTSQLQVWWPECCATMLATILMGEKVVINKP